jgi:hypothetical protein
MGRQQQVSQKKKNGQSIAPETHMMSQTVHPIDTLVVQQLENLLDGERALKARYAALDASLDTPEVRMAFSYELAELKDRADRLYRFVSALEHYGSLDYRSLEQHEAASLA